MSTIEDINRAVTDLEEAVTEHRKATERQQSAELLFNAARDDAVAALDLQDETLQELVQLCGALLLQHAKPSKRLARFAVYATQPVGRELMLDTGDESRAQTEHQRLRDRVPGLRPVHLPPRVRSARLDGHPDRGRRPGTPGAAGPRDHHARPEGASMRFAVKSAGGITEAFLHADDVDEAVKDAAKQIVEDYELPVHLELWTAPPAGDFADTPGPRRPSSSPCLRRRCRLSILRRSPTANRRPGLSRTCAKPANGPPPPPPRGADLPIPALIEGRSS